MRKCKSTGNRILSVLLAVMMIVSVFSVGIISSNASTGGKTRNDAVSWANSKVGSSLDYDGVYGAQCVDLTKYYYKYLGVSPVNGNGCDYATNALPSGWTRIKYYSGFVPQPGDIAVWTYTTSAYGHVAIITSADSSRMYVVEQNGSTGVTRSHSYSYTYGTFYGVIRPDFSGSSGGGTQSCSCSTSYAGNYVVSAQGRNLNIRGGHSTSYGILGSIPDGTEIYISKASAAAGGVGWGHVTYNGISGYVTMEGVAKKVTTYSVKYNANGGTGAPSAQTKQSGIAISLSKTVPTKFGYTFKGWSKSSSGTTVDYAPGASFNENADVTLYAIWTSAIELSPILASRERTVKFQFENKYIYYVITPSVKRRYRFECTGNLDTQIHIYDASGNCIASDDNSGTLNNFELDYLFEKNTKYYIKISTRYGYTGECQFKITMLYKIQYYGNGGAEFTPNQYKPYNESIWLSAIKPTRPGYEFIGWSKDPNATTAEYFPNTLYSENESMNLYAVWKSTSPTLYTVNYNANGGGVSPLSKTVEQGNSVNLPTPTKSYNLTYNANGGNNAPASKSVSLSCKGWSTSSSATSATYSCGASYKPTGNITLYAVWNTSTSTSLSTIQPTRSGYNFLGWSKNSAATTASYKAGDQITFSANTTLYAVWEKIPVTTYKLTFNANGGSGAPSAKTGATSYIIPSTVPTRSGYNFLGWSKYSNSTVADYKSGDTITLTSNTTLYAVWEKQTSAKSYKLSFNANGGSNAPEALTGADEYIIPSKVPVREGYIFLGWSKVKSSTTAKYMMGETITLTANTTLYAVWEKIPPTPGTGITEITVRNKYLYYNESAKLSIDFEGEECDYTVEYMSSDPYVASVSEDGYVYGNGTGMVEITVTVTDEYGHIVEDTCTVTVEYAWWQWLILIFLFGWIWY